MPAIRLHPASKARREAVLDAVREAASAWERAWAQRPGGLDVVLAEPAADQGVLPADVACFGAESGQVALCADAPALARWLLPASASAPTGAAARVVDAALADLAARLLGVRQAEPAALAPRRFAPRAGAIEAVVRTPGASIAVRLDGMRALGLHPRASSPTRATLAPRSQAVGGLVVGVECVLPLGRLPLADMLGLRPGDVVVSRAGLDAALELRAEGRRGAVAGRLARTGDGRKAFCALPPSSSAQPSPVSVDSRNPAP